ncbi:hypothetical protein [Sphingomonas sp.]|jgi:hypothetical protein|uniref:hypothetical protein n=1 Tax=Sphingomonas sp. TaxID=28214 RepID=UPI00260499D1|nr:hypothetical protein [Sphingomonas sp.]MDF2602937.1 hypothetical protein [Sphingomonas sp.]
MSPVVYPPFELQADRGALTALLGGMEGYKVEALGGRTGELWLRDREGRDWVVAVDQRDLRFKFEVFALGMMSIEQMRERWRNWKAPTIPPDMPEPFRSLMATRPPEPVAPVAYDDWPLKANRVEVLRRAEFIVEDVDVGPTFGDHPNAQSTAVPGEVPHEASASCVVAVGLLFSGREGRLLIASDWMPMDLIVTQEAGKIDEFTAACERVELRTYMEEMGRKPQMSDERL